MIYRLLSFAAPALAASLLFTACQKNPEDQSLTSIPHSHRKSDGRSTYNPGRNREVLAHVPHPVFKEPRAFVPSAGLAGKRSSDPDWALEWNRFRLAGDYERTGRTNALWDAEAVAALEAYANARAHDGDTQAVSNAISQIVQNAAAAVKAGCDDPMVLYLHTRFGLTAEKGMTDAILAAHYSEASDKMEATDYSSIRKVLVSHRAAHALQASLKDEGTARMVELKVRELCHLREALYDTNMPPAEAKYITREIWEISYSNTVIQDEFEMTVLPALEKFWVAHAFTYLIKGELYIKKAWNWRGVGWANTVTAQGSEGMEKSLDLAREALQKAWELDPKDAQIPIQMLSVCLGQNVPRSEMERWFEHAMEIDPGCYDAAYSKLYYLEPKWHGSAEDLLTFGHECVASGVWKGKVPLILVDVHYALSKYLDKKDRDTYWLQPGVWPDIRASYERFFELNPQETGYRHNYARYAYMCAKYPEFLHQLSYFNRTNYEFFGGQTAFSNMVATAHEKVGPGK